MHALYPLNYVGWILLSASHKMQAWFLIVDTVYYFIRAYRKCTQKPPFRIGQICAHQKLRNLVCAHARPIISIWVNPSEWITHNSTMDSNCWYSVLLHTRLSKVHSKAAIIMGQISNRSNIPCAVDIGTGPRLTVDPKYIIRLTIWSYHDFNSVLKLERY
jgi:hypothetical protein